MRDRRGYIKLWRKINAPESSLRSLPGEQRWVAVVCLLEANWKDHVMLSAGERVLVQRGSFVTSRNSLAETCGLSVRTVRTALKNLSNLDFLTQEATQRFTHISITNYDFWQSDEDATDPMNAQEPTQDRPKTDPRPTTIKERKKERRQEDLFRSPGERFDFDQAYQHYPRKQKKAQGMAALRKKSKRLCTTQAEYDRLVECCKWMGDRWQGKSLQFCPTWEAFVNGKRWMDDEWPAPSGPEDEPPTNPYAGVVEQLPDGSTRML